MKMIKLSDTHYVVVDDSEIKEGDWYIDDSNCIRQSVTSDKEYWGRRMDYKKITHSTQPLEPSIYSTRHDNKGYLFIKPLTLSEVEEAVYGYSVEKFCKEKVEKIYSKYIPKDELEDYITLFQLGFKANQELVKDKLFTVDDVSKIFAVGVQLGINQELFTQQGKPLQDENVVLQRTLQSLLPKTEWDIEFVEDKLKLI